MAIQDLCSDFAAAVSHLATTIQMNAALMPDNRNISGVASGGSDCGRDGNTQGGRNQGRGNRGGHAGHGGCRRGGNIYLRTYSPSQWCALSTEDHKKVSKGRK
jgi:hypothetical protein